MDALMLGMIVAAAIAATRCGRNDRWPLWAAASLAAMPFVVRGVRGVLSGPDVAALHAVIASSIAWPVACALVAGWVFRASRRPALQGRRRKRQ